MSNFRPTKQPRKSKSSKELDPETIAYSTIQIYTNKAYKRNNTLDLKEEFQ